MKYINSFNINTSDLQEAALSRQYRVDGEKDAEFILQIFNKNQQFYNFKTKSFSATFTSTSSLNVKMKGNSHAGSISFPANGSGDTYTILLLTPPDKDTELTFASGKYSYSTTITQVVNTVLTFTPVTANSESYETFADSGSENITSTVSPVSTTTVTKALDWDFVNTNDDDAQGFGLRLIRQPIDTDWYFTATETVDGAVSSGTKVTVDDLTDLVTGMYITAVSGGSLSGTPVVTAVNTVTKTLTISSAQTFADGITLTFQARGGNVIKKAIGADIDFSTWNSDVISATSAKLTQIVRTDANSTTITLKDTYGVSGGGFVKVSGANVINTSANTVQTVTADVGGGGGDGLVVVQVAQVAAQGTLLYFEGSAKTVTIANNIVINKQPSSNRTIYLNLDNFITPGVSGS